MNENDIKKYFAAASLSDEKKAQLKETLRQRFPQQSGDIKAAETKAQPTDNKPARISHHKAASIVAAAAAVVLVVSGGVFMAQNIHDNEPNAGTNTNAVSNTTADNAETNKTDDQKYFSADFLKLANTVLDCTKTTEGKLGIITGNPTSCDITYDGDYDKNIEGKAHSTRYYVELLEVTDSGLPSVDFMTADNSYEPYSLAIDILSEIKMLDDETFSKAVNCRIELHIESGKSRITISDGDNSISLKYGSDESFTTAAVNMADQLKSDLLDIYDENALQSPDDAVFSYSPADYDYYSDIMSSNDITEYVKSDYAQNGHTTAESLTLLTLKAIKSADLAFDMSADYFTVDMLSDSFTLYRCDNDGSWNVYTSAPFSNTYAEASPWKTAQYIFEKAKALVTQYNTDGKKLHFDTVNSLDLAKELALSNVPDIDSSYNVTAQLFAYELWLDMLSHDREYGDLDLSTIDFSVYFEKDKDGSAYDVKQVDVTIEGDTVYSYTTDEHDSVETYDANDSALS